MLETCYVHYNALYTHIHIYFHFFLPKSVFSFFSFFAFYLSLLIFKLLKCPILLLIMGQILTSTNLHVEVLIPSISECDCIKTEGL